MKDVLKNLPPLVDTVTFATKIDEVKSDQREHPNRNLRFRAIADSSEPTSATLLSKLMKTEIIENIVSRMDVESRNLLILRFE
ncbi:hypothetical protein LK838_004501 [Salmonella enterica]|nr:hypothetical protein [Salmonella enterica]